MSRGQVVALERDILDWLERTVKFETAAGACTSEIVDLVGPDENDDLKVGLGFSCPSPAEDARIEFHPFDEAIPDYRNIVSVHTPKTDAGFVFTSETPVLVLGSFNDPSAHSRFREFFELGVEHIWTGYDHLLFLLALLLPGGTLARIAGIVTAFTIAHSITLALAALDIVRLPVEPVEIAIAGSIVVAAAAALRAGATDRRWIITFAFGLIHGFGFASVLREAGLPPGGALVPLLSFNLGVEAGQLAIVFVAVPLLRLLTRGARGLAARRAMAWATIAAGVFWMAERTAAWLGSWGLVYDGPRRSVPCITVRRRSSPPSRIHPSPRCEGGRTCAHWSSQTSLVPRSSRLFFHPATSAESSETIAPKLSSATSPAMP
jgi:hydrogenase/urease accessory protein HupE